MRGQTQCYGVQYRRATFNIDIKHQKQPIKFIPKIIRRKKHQYTIEEVIIEKILMFLSSKIIVCVINYFNLCYQFISVTGVFRIIYTSDSLRQFCNQSIHRNLKKLLRVNYKEEGIFLK